MSFLFSLLVSVELPAERRHSHAGMIVKAAKDANMGCLFPTMNVEMAPMLLGMGATMICCGFDSVTMVRGMRDNLAAITESITDFKTKQEEK